MAEREFHFAPVTYVQDPDGHYVPENVDQGDACDQPECPEVWAWVVERRRGFAGPVHPSAGAWVGKHLCWFHAGVVRHLAERYGLQLIVRKLTRES